MSSPLWLILWLPDYCVPFLLSAFTLLLLDFNSFLCGDTFVIWSTASVLIILGVYVFASHLDHFTGTEMMSLYFILVFPFLRGLRTMACLLKALGTNLLKKEKSKMI